MFLIGTFLNLLKITMTLYLCQMSNLHKIKYHATNNTLLKKIIYKNSELLFLKNHYFLPFHVEQMIVAAKFSICIHLRNFFLKPVCPTLFGKFDLKSSEKRSVFVSLMLAMGNSISTLCYLLTLI